MGKLALAALLCAAGALYQPAAAATWHVVIRDLAYHDVPKEAHVGDVVVWTNEDFIDHTATARNGSFDIVLPPDKTARTRLKRTGKIAFYCRFHPQMTGMVTVLP